MECTIKDECPSRMSLIGRCSGRGVSNTAACIQCSINCQAMIVEPYNAGQYITIESIASCAAGTATDAACVPCNSCPNGKYASIPCSGTTTEDTVCTPCRMTCPERQYLRNQCFESRHNAYADPNANACSDCLPCANGQFQLKVCSAGGIVSHNKTDRVCADCTQSCPVGQYLSGVCDPYGQVGPTCVNCVLCNAGKLPHTSACTI